MKCIKNLKTGTIMRVENNQANNMVGSTWSYVSKSEWKSTFKKTNDDIVGHDMGGSYEVKKTKKNKK